MSGDFVPLFLFFSLLFSAILYRSLPLSPLCSTGTSPLSPFLAITIHSLWSIVDRVHRHVALLSPRNIDPIRVCGHQVLSVRGNVPERSLPAAVHWQFPRGDEQSCLCSFKWFKLFSSIGKPNTSLFNGLESSKMQSIQYFRRFLLFKLLTLKLSRKPLSIKVDFQRIEFSQFSFSGEDFVGRPDNEVIQEAFTFAPNSG